MSDYNSSLPIRTESDGDVVIKVGDGTTPAQQWAIDSSGRALVKLQDTNGNDLVIGTNGGVTVVITDGTNTAAIDASGNLSTLVTDGTNQLAITASGQVTVVLTDGTNTVAVDASGNLSTLVTDGTETLAINTDGSINTVVVNQAQGGEVHIYDTEAALVPSTPTTVVEYTVPTGKLLQLKSIMVSSSAKFKVEVKAGTASSETTRAVGFGSSANGNCQIDFAKNIEVAAADKVILVITNMDKQNADVYGFINGANIDA